MSYLITSPVSVTNSVPVTLNLSNTSSSQNWSLSTNNSDQLKIGSTTTPNTIILSPSGNVQLNNVVNSVIDSATNVVTADKLRSATTTISIGGATAPTSGQVLTAISSTSAGWQTPSSGGVTSISAATSSIVLSPDPIISTGTIDIGNSIEIGSKGNNPLPAKQGILDIPSNGTSTFTGISATGNSLINMTNSNNYTGTADGVVVAGGINTINNVYSSLIAGNNISVTNSNRNIITGDNNILDNVLFSNISGQTHNISGGFIDGMITGQSQTIVGGNTLIVGGTTNNITGSVVSLLNGYNNILNTTTTSTMLGESNSMTGCTRCLTSGFGNSITTGFDTQLIGYQNTFSGAVPTDVNFMLGFNNTLANALAHRFNLWMGFGMLGRAATTYNSSILMGTGAPDATNAFYNGGSGISIPVGYDSNASLNLYGDRINMACNSAAEIRVFGNNIRNSTAPATGDDYTNKTYVDSKTFSSSGLITLGAGGTFTVLVNPLPTTSRITVNIQPSQAPLGVVWVSNITLDTSFTISSTNAGDSGVNVYYQIYPN